MEDTKLAYSAGFFDGEGCCTITSTKASATRRAYHRPRVAVVNTVYASLLQYYKRWGGSICKVSHSENKHKDCYIWSIYSARKVKRFIIDILPYLRIKRKQALLLLAFCDTGDWRGGGDGYRILSPEIREKRERIKEEMMQLNKKGKKCKTRVRNPIV